MASLIYAEKTLNENNKNIQPQTKTKKIQARD